MTKRMRGPKAGRWLGGGLVGLGLVAAGGVAQADTVSYSQVTSTNDQSQGIYDAMSFVLGDGQVRVQRQELATPATGQFVLRRFTLFDGGGRAAGVPLALVLRERATGQEVARSSNFLSLTGSAKGTERHFEFAGEPVILETTTPYVVTFVTKGGKTAAGRFELNNTASPASQLLAHDGGVRATAYSPRFRVSGDAVAFQNGAATFKRLGPTDATAKGNYGGFRFSLSEGTAVSVAQPEGASAPRVAVRQLVLFDAGNQSLNTQVYVSLRRTDGTEIARSDNGLIMTGGAKGRPLKFDFSSNLPELDRSGVYVVTFVNAKGEPILGRLEISRTPSTDQSRMLTLQGHLIAPAYSPRFEVVGDALPGSIVARPSYYYVLVLAGQSNMVGYGEELADPTGLDAPDARIVQVGRAAGRDHTLVPATASLDHVQDMAGSDRSRSTNHPKVRDGTYPWPQYGGTVGAGLSLAKKLLPYLPSDAGILLVPGARGGAGLTSGIDNVYTMGSTRAYVDGAGGGMSTGSWGRWGVSGGHAANPGGKTGLYLDLLERTRWALGQNSRNVLAGVVWMQGESDLSDPAEHKKAFEAQVRTFADDVNATHRYQCLRSDCSRTPWVVGDTSVGWKGAGYDKVYLDTYARSPLSQVSFVPFMFQSDGVTPTVTNSAVAYSASNLTGADARTSSRRDYHFGTRGLREVVGPRLAVGLMQAANRAAAIEP